MPRSLAPLAPVALPLAALLCACGTSTPPPGTAIADDGDYAAWVNPFVGTQAGAPDFGTGGGAGNTFPGATLPFGMLQFSPDTSPSLDNYAGGYTYSDTKILGFSLTHVSGAGCSIYQDIPILPTLVPIDQSPADPLSPGLKPAFLAGFDHLFETAEPGYYRVRLDPDSAQPIDVALTAAERSGMSRFDFPAGAAPQVLVNAGGSQMPNESSSVSIDPQRREISGSATSGGFCYQDDRYTVYFAAEFDRPFTSWGTWSKDLLSPGSTSATDVGVLRSHADPIPGAPITIPGDPSGTARAGAYVGFDPADGSTVRMRVAISFVSVDNARANLRAEMPDWDFDSLRAAARARWNAELGRIRIATPDARLKRIFYTALYHSLLAPNLFNDVSGEYLGFDGAVHDSARPVYSTFSGWDMYRSQWPLLAMLDTQRVSDMTQSLVLAAQQSGALPKWSYANQHSNVMVGDPAAILIASAWAFGARDFDTGAALDAMIKGATEPAAPTQYLAFGNDGYIQRGGLAEYQALGYIPYEVNVPNGIFGLVNGGLVWGSSATTLEYALADFAIDRFATALGQPERAAELRARSSNWKNVFNTDTGYAEPRLAAGTFLPGNDPGSGNAFVEGSSAQYTWFVPHDVDGLIEALGGRDAALARLDDFFSELNAGPESPYAFLGNEPSLFTPWIYASLNEPDRIGPIVHQALTTLYDDSPGGMPGNDDLGAMSAWWVLSALGMCPCVPGTNVIVTSAPLVRLVD
ncbi:MAG: GH92 family glycosyl hydrolase [Sinimarinibacterium sp.]|jgi:predicted alpha-1,2-mannosidase